MLEILSHGPARAIRIAPSHNTHFYHRHLGGLDVWILPCGASRLLSGAKGGRGDPAARNRMEDFAALEVAMETDDLLAP